MFPHALLRPIRRIAPATAFLLLTSALVAQTQPTFDVATIRPSSSSVQFERNGETSFAHGTLRMRDVTVATCIHVAYSIPLPLIQSATNISNTHYDITAKAAPDSTESQMRLMLQSLLQERFGLTFHHEKKEMRVYNLTIAKGGIKMHASTPGGQPYHQNSATGMVARSISMPELADYISDPLGAPLTDHTGLPGRYDFTIDFTPYVDMEHDDSGVRPDPIAVLKAAFKGDLGLDLIPSKDIVDIFVVDHLGPPTDN
jgi:uncharacterized protein (TIGR03435 family)